MSSINEEELPDTSTGEGDPEVSTPETTVDEVATEPSATDAPPAKTKQKSNREDLIKSLTGGDAKEEDDEDEDDEVEAVEAETPKSKEAKTEVSAEKPEGEKHDTSDKRSKAKERFEVLTNHNRELKAKVEEAEPKVKYAKAILDYCNTAGISAEDHGMWLAVAAAAKKDPASAVPYLEKLGIKPREVVQTVKEVPQELEDKILELATSGDLTPEGMKLLFGITRTARAPAKPAAPAVTEPPAQTQTSAQLRTPDFHSPEKHAYDTALAKAVADIDSKDADYAKKYPADWSKLRPQITEAMKTYQGTHPRQWIGFFESEVAKALAKVVKAVKAPESLRPSTHTTVTNKPAPNSRAAIVAELTGRKA
jgi:hypothetical protein